MPTYSYFCSFCESNFDVIKSISCLEDEELCGKCCTLAERQMSRVNISPRGEFIASFNPAFGEVVKSKRHQADLISKLKIDTGREMIEIGNEPLDKIHAYYDNAREIKREESWDEPTEKVLAEVLN